MPGRGRPRREETCISECTQGPEAEEQDAKKKEKPTKEESPGKNGAELNKKTPKNTRKTGKLSDSNVTSSEMTKADVMTATEKMAARGARPKIPDVRAKSPEEEIDNVNDKIKIRNVRKDKHVSTCERDKSSINEVALNRGMKQLSLEEKADVASKREPRTILHATLEKLKIRMSEKSKASEVINKIEDVILKHLKSNTLYFKEVEKTLHTGSYYENLKISNPDEFDIMFPIPVKRVDMQPFSEDGAFYSASLKREYSPLNKFQSETNHLPASEILQEFRKEVIKSLQKFPGVDFDKKKRGCPAVTLNVEVDSRLISLDIVLCLVVQSSWPTFTKDGLKIEGWLGRKVKQKYKYVPYYLVAKYEGDGTKERNGVLAKDTWRVSFSHVEKDILKNHGSEKTCCEEDGTRCCRKDCLKLLKHLLSLLKDQDKSFDKFCSYHAKTTLLHACCSRTKDSQWAAADLSQCFEQLLKDFEDHLEHHELNNFFIPTQNLLSGCSQKSCKSLAKHIKEQREGGFPIFN